MKCFLAIIVVRPHDNWNCTSELNPRYLERHRETYYDCLLQISTAGDWNDWIAFFLKAICIQSQENNLKVQAIMALYEAMKQQIYAVTHSQFGMQVLDAIFNRPIFKTTDFISETGIHKPTAMNLLRQLKKEGILLELQEGSGRRAAVLCFPALINIAEGKQII